LTLFSAAGHKNGGMVVDTAKNYTDIYSSVDNAACLLFVAQAPTWKQIAFHTMKGSCAICWWQNKCEGEGEIAAATSAVLFAVVLMVR
jgi:hypothetical protein